MSTLGKAISKAKKVSAAAALHQRNIGDMADGANSPNHRKGPADQNACRQAFHHTEQTSEGDILVSEVLYAVRNENEFLAYWNTMINPENTDTPKYAGDGTLIAKDEAGNAYNLKPIGDSWGAMNAGGEAFPVMWEFLSTRVADTTTTGNGINVVYSDGRIEYIPYPQTYPSSPGVAELSRRYAEAL
jgi:hypothetical protein